MHLTAPSHWSRSIVTSGRDPSERVVTIVVARKQEPKSEAIIEIASLSEQAQLVLVEQREQNASISYALYCERKSDLATVFLRLSELPTFPLDRLSRYEHLLWRQARQLVFTLESLRRRGRRRSRSNFPFSFRASGK